MHPPNLNKWLHLIDHLGICSTLKDHQPNPIHNPRNYHQYHFKLDFKNSNPQLYYIESSDCFVDQSTLVYKEKRELNKKKLI